MRGHKIAVVALIEYQNKIILGKKKFRKNNFLSGLWHIPGGKVNFGELEEEALIREMKEETGLDIIVNNFLAEKYISRANMVAKWYNCSPLTYDLKAGDDLSDVKYVSKTDIFNVCEESVQVAWPEEVVNYLKNNQS